MKHSFKRVLSLLLVLTMVLSALPVMAQAADSAIVLANAQGAAPIYIDRDGADYDGLSLVAVAASKDFEAVTGGKGSVYAVATSSEAKNAVLEPEIKDHVVSKIGSEKVVIIAGTVNDKLITDLKLDWDIKASGESFKADDFERYQIKVVTGGGQTKIVIAGADKRGTSYGLFHITQDLCGVSPWIWWADVAPAHKDSLSFSAAELETLSKRPSVNYRGFFFNDENPNLDGFADSHFGGLNYMFYDHVFELMLRLKGNFLWPAMWSNAFGSDGVEGLGKVTDSYSSLAKSNNKFAAMEADYHYLLGGAMYVDQPGNAGAAMNAPNTNTTNYSAAESAALGDGSLKAIGYGEYPMTLANAVLATRYGIMVGASHHEPMARAGVEWGDLQGYNDSTDTYTQPTATGATDNKSRQAWNYLTNPTNISNFWSDGIKRNGSLSNLLTIGMRGENDTALTDANGRTLSTKQNAELLKDVIREQDRILHQYGLEDTPQLIALYKEVENCWYAGDRNNPSGADKSAALYYDEEITDLLGADTNRIVMFCEDNNGYLRTLGEYGEKERFNYGLYYHFDFVGSPHTSMWTNTMPLQRSWDNLTTAYEYGVDDAWVVNVGDLKPMELPLSYFMELAYDFETYGSNAANDTDETITWEEFTLAWVKQQFAAGKLSEAEYAELAQMLTDYTHLNGNRKPEQQKRDTYSLSNYNEAQEILAICNRIETSGEKFLKKFEGTDLYDAYYELVYYTAMESANTNKLLIYQGLNQFYASSGSALTNIYADKVNAGLAADRAYTAAYNKLGPDLNGQNKWYRMMITSPFNNETVCGITARAHLNYSNWNNESSQSFSPTTVTLSTAGTLRVDVTGSTSVVSSGSLTLPDFDSTVMQAYRVTMSNAGLQPITYEVTDVPAWVKLDGEATGSIQTAKTLGICVDWSKVTTSTSGSFKIVSGGQTVTVNVNAKVTEIPADVPKGTAFLSNGQFSFIATNYTAMGTGHSKAGDDKEVGWVSMPGYGKTQGSVKPFPVYTDDCKAGEGPWLDYTVYVPEDQTGSYQLNIFFGQSNDISFFEGKELNYAIQVNGGNIETKNALTNGYVAGGNGWYDNINNCGHVIQVGSYSLKAGLNTIRIYAMDQNLLLQKIVLSKGSGAFKSSYMGAPQSYRAGDPEPSQQMLVYDAYIDHEHEYDSVEVKPTCTEGGSVTGKCKICGTAVVSYTPALGHDWDEGKITVPATEEAAGKKVLTCQRCGETKNVRIPRVGAVIPDDIDFTDSASADRIEIVNQKSTAIRAGEGLYLVSTADGFEPANDQLSGNAANTPVDLVKIPVEGDWVATMKFRFNQSGQGYYEFFGFYAMDDYNNVVGIRGGDGTVQDFLRKNGTITAEQKPAKISNSGMKAASTHWFRIAKFGDSYTCYWSIDNQNYVEMFSFEDTGINGDYLAIDAYTGMSTGYNYMVESITFSEDIPDPGDEPDDPDDPPVIDPTEQVNYALSSNGGSAQASSGVEGNAANVIDGSRNKNARIRWASENLPATLTITLSEVRAISTIDVISQVPDSVESGVTEMGETTNLGLKNITVSYSEDGNSWNVFAVGDSNNNLAWQRFEKAAPVNAKYVKIEIPESATFDGWARILEVQVLGTPVSACEHDYKAVKTDPTCTAKGKTVYTCTKCGKSYEEEIAALGHDFKAGDIVAPTCTEGGYTVYKCSRCDATENRDKVAALGHKYEDGKCSECGEADPDYKACPSVIFTDAPAKDDWAHEGIDFCVEKEYMNGVRTDLFNPAGNVTRAQLVTILYRVAEKPEIDESKVVEFIDVEDDQWYSDAIAWASAEGIVNGVGKNKFNPMGAITREQIAAIFFRYAKAEKIEGDLKAFPDYEDADDYAVDALVWAVQEGIITGVKSGEVVSLKPLNNATRAQIATIIMRYLDGEYKCGK